MYENSHVNSIFDPTDIYQFDENGSDENKSLLNDNSSYMINGSFF